MKNKILKQEIAGKYDMIFYYPDEDVHYVLID